MILIGIDIGKNFHTFSIVSRDSGEILLQPTEFPNTASGFSTLCAHLISYDKAGMINKIRKCGTVLEEDYREDGIFVRAYVDNTLNI